MTKDKAPDFGIISFVSKWRATVNEDWHYSFAVPLWCRSLPRFL